MPHWLKLFARYVFNLFFNPEVSSTYKAISCMGVFLQRLLPERVPGTDVTAVIICRSDTSCQWTWNLIAVASGNLIAIGSRAASTGKRRFEDLVLDNDSSNSSRLKGMRPCSGALPPRNCKQARSCPALPFNSGLYEQNAIKTLRGGKRFRPWRPACRLCR
jgi:hypothetical protein